MYLFLDAELMLSVRADTSVHFGLFSTSTPLSTCGCFAHPVPTIEYLCTASSVLPRTVARNLAWWRSSGAVPQRLRAKPMHEKGPATVSKRLRKLCATQVVGQRRPGLD